MNENGVLEPYYDTSDRIMSREDFVDSYKGYTNWSWNEVFNGGTSPYQSVSPEIDASFDINTGRTQVNYGIDYLRDNASTLNSIDIGDISLGRAEKPEIIYLAPGQSIEYDIPWNTYDNYISGGESGTYLVYDSNANGYYVVDSTGTYHNSSNNVTRAFISYDELINDRTTWTR
jgi:hypothetical protein